MIKGRKTIGQKVNYNRPWKNGSKSESRREDKINYLKNVKYQKINSILTTAIKMQNGTAQLLEAFAIITIHDTHD